MRTNLIVAILGIALLNCAIGGDFEGAVAVSKAEAIRQFPSLQDPRSRLFDVVDYVTMGLIEENNEIIRTNSNWPLLVAQECSQNLDQREASIKQQRALLSRSEGVLRTEKESLDRIRSSQQSDAWERGDHTEVRRIRRLRDEAARANVRQLQGLASGAGSGSPANSPSLTASELSDLADGGVGEMIQILEAQKLVARTDQKKKRLTESINKLKAYQLLMRQTVPNLNDRPSNTTSSGRQRPVGTYLGGTTGHWVSKTFESGTYVQLEDKSIWEVDPLERIDSVLWLAAEKIVVVESDEGTPGYDFLLINPDQKSSVHAKLIEQ